MSGRRNLLSLFVVVALGTWAGHVRAGIVTFDFSKAPMNTAGSGKSTGLYNLVSIYRVPGGFGVSFLIPPVPLNAPKWGDSVAGIFNPKQTADTVYGPKGWTFTASNQTLPDNSLIVTADQIHNTTKQDYVGIEGGTTPPLTPDSGFAVLLPKTLGNLLPNPPAMPTHWIQVTFDNYVGGYGPLMAKVDTPSVSGSPYYDDGATANATNFLDAPLALGGFALPGETDGTELNHLFLAAAYVASGPKATDPGQVTIYNGVVWGWANVVFSVNNLFGLAQAFDQAMTSVAFLNSAFKTDLSGLLDPADLQTIEAAFDQEVAALSSVPEPATWLLLATGYLLGYGWRRPQRAA